MKIKKVKVHFIDFATGKEFETRASGKVFDVYEKDGKYGIDFDEPNSWDYIRKGCAFAPFEQFASNTVIFEDIETGKKYHFDNITNGLKEV